MSSNDRNIQGTSAVFKDASDSQQLYISRKLEKLKAELMEIASPQNLGEMLDFATKEFANIFSASACAISRWDKEEDKLHTLSEYGQINWGKTLVDDKIFALKDFPATLNVLNNNIANTVILDDTAIDSNEKILLKKYKVKSLLMLPLASPINVFGLIEIYDRKKRRFETKDIMVARLFSQNVTIALENALSFSDIQKGFEEQKALREAAFNISSSLDLHTTLTKIAEQVCKLIDVTSVYITKLNMESKSILALAEYFGPASKKTERVSDIGDVYDHSADFDEILDFVADGKPVVYHYDDDDLIDNEIETFKKYGCKTIMEIPMQIGEDQYTILELWDTREKRRFTENEIELCELIASQAAIAMQKATLLSESKKAYEEQKALREAAMAISSSLDLNTTLTKIAEQVCELVDATSIEISSIDLTSKTSTVLAEYFGPNSSKEEQVSSLGEVWDHTIHFEEMADFFHEGEPQIYHHDDPDLDEVDTLIIEKYGIKTVLEIPLTSGKNLISLEVYESRYKREYSDEDIALCQSLTSQAAIAVENAFLYNQAQEEIEHRKNMEEQLRHDALHDPLTKLPNRELFMDRLEQLIVKKKRFKELEFAILYLDLDRFKQVNDSFGHDVGDKLLKKLGQIFKTCVREVDTVSRFGGDEFVILLEGPMDADDALSIAERIQEALSNPLEIDEHLLSQSASMGIALSTQEFESAEDIIRNADIGMYNAKEKGSGRIEFYSVSKGVSAKLRFELEADIRQAFKDDQFMLHYQPIIDLKTSRLFGFEALLRWQKKDGTIVYPSDFMAVLEETGLLIDIGYCSMNEACGQIIRWEKKYPKLAPLTISINVSGNQITHPKFVDEVNNAIKKTGIDPAKIVFEITENIFIQETGPVSNILEKLQAIGVQVHLDDFGTGFSSLGYLTKLPINSIKIDRLFIDKIDSEDDKNGLLQSMFVMANELNMEVIAEGIERQEQLSVLNDIGCDYGQGFFFKKAQSVKETDKYLKKYVKKSVG